MIEEVAGSDFNTVEPAENEVNSVSVSDGKQLI